MTRGEGGVRPDTLLCETCFEWKPDVAFRRSGDRWRRRFRESHCSECQRARERAKADARRAAAGPKVKPITLQNPCKCGICKPYKGETFEIPVPR